MADYLDTVFFHNQILQMLYCARIDMSEGIDLARRKTGNTV